MKARLAFVLAIIAVSAVAFVSASYRRYPPEPVWKGHGLSEWLQEYDNHLRFPAGEGWTARSNAFKDEEIEAALDGIGPRALPFLLRWLQVRYPPPGHIRPWLNLHLLKLHVPFQFRIVDQFNPPNGMDLPELGFRGIQYSGTNALPLLPALLKMTESRDVDTRLRAYEAAFFTFPERKDFLALADKALKDKGAGYQAAVAQWMAQRFPEEAERLGLYDRLPQNVQRPKAQD